MSKRSIFVAVALSMVAVLSLGQMPSNAAIGGVAAAALSPHLTNGFPCQPSAPANILPAFDALARYAQNQSVTYTGCSGDIYSTAQGAINSGTTAGSGVNAGDANTPYSVAGANGTFSATYTYAEPCQQVGSMQEALSGEANGTLTVSGTATGRYGSASVTSGSTSARFWWSRVGLTAVVGLRDITITLSTTAGTKVIHETTARGLAAAVFIPTQSPNCANVAVPPANAIIIASPSLTVSSPA